ncbi:MAG: HD domain-containing protein [Candidatus Methanofastidiosa archaeon]|nr:HD domain-containing protein [Candidatus Methanofastidiosa archaeon]
MHTMRYQNLYKHKARSVAQHEWSVSRIAMGLAYWETLKFNNEVSMHELLSTTLLHDTPEYIVGDVLSNVKRTTPKMLEAVEKSEKEAFDTEISRILPKQWHDEFRRKMLSPKNDTIEGKIVTAADAIDVILECVEEIKLGNAEHFKEIAQGVCKKLLEIDLPSVKYFLKYSLSDFGLDIRSTYGEEVYLYIQKLKNSD